MLSHFVNRCFFALLLSMVIFLAPLVGFAQTKSDLPNTILILDGSGSMWGKIKGGHKVVIARRAIGASLSAFEDQLNFGLMAYGHRRRGACNDIQLIEDLAKLNPLKISRRVKRVKPLGKTPITDALQKAITRLQKEKTGGSIILLTDGPENCRRDPCALINSQLAKDQNLTVHVIAFSMQPKEAKSLACLANKSGGLFLSANTQKQLSDALSATLKATLKGPGAVAVVEPTKSRVQRIKAELTLTARLGQSSSVLNEGLLWKLNRLNNENSPEEDMPSLGSAKGSPTFDLNAGAYRVVAQYQGFEITKDITLKKGDTRSEQIIFNLNRLQLPVGWASANSRSGFGKLLLQRQDTKEIDAKTTLIELTDKEQTQLIPAGAYKLIGVDNGNLQSWFIHAQAGKVTSLPIWENTGRLRLVLRDETTGAPLEEPVVRIFSRRETDKQTPHEIPQSALQFETARSTSKAPLFDLKAGKYWAKIDDGFASKIVNFDMVAKQLTKITVALERATLNIGFEKDDPLTNHTLSIFQINKTGQERLLGTTSQLDQKLTLPPGRYRLSLVTGQAGNTINKTVELKAGHAQKVAFSNVSTPTSFVISNRDDPLSRHQIFWQLFEKSGALIWQSTKPYPRLHLPKGEYHIKAEIGDDIYSRQFTLKNKDKLELDLANSLQK